MHDFNSVSGTWSHTQLKGEEGGEETNVRNGGRGGRGRRGMMRRTQVWWGEVEGWGHSSSLPPSLLGFLDGTRAGRKRRRRKGKGGGEQGGAGAAFVCFPRFKASLEK